MQDWHDASERIQREVLISMYQCCPAAARADLGLGLEMVADVAVSLAGREPSILLNRAQGLGSREPVTRSTIDAVVERYRHHGIERFFFHVYPSTLPPDGAAWLAETGLVKSRGWMQFLRSTEPAPSARTELDIERIDARHAVDFAGIVCGSFGLGDLSRPYIAAMFEDARWRCFMSFAAGEPAGVGAVFIDGNLAYLGFGATDPRFRRRGSQGAIMCARIQAALDAGCDYLFTETGEAVEGEQQTSYRNIMRFGFQPVALCENWCPG